MRRNSALRRRRRGGTKSTPTTSSAQGRSSTNCATRVPNSPPMPVMRMRFALTDLPVPLEDDPQTVEGQPRLVVLHGPRVRQERLGQAAGRDDFTVAELGNEPVDEPVDLGAEAVDHAGLDRFGRRLPDDVLRFYELHTAQARGLAEERIERDFDPGKNRAAEIFALLADRLDRRRGTEVDDDRRPAIEVERTNRVRDAVRADLLRVVVQDRHAGAHARLDDERGKPEVAVRHLAQLRGDARNAGRDRDSGDRIVEGEAMKAEELLDHQRELVGGS